MKKGTIVCSIPRENDKNVTEKKRQQRHTSTKAAQRGGRRRTERRRRPEKRRTERRRRPSVTSFRKHRDCKQEEKTELGFRAEKVSKTNSSMISYMEEDRMKNGRC